MATSHSVSFKADADQVWRAVVRLVSSSGYPLLKTDASAKHLTYQASGGAFAWRQNVQVSLVEVEQDAVVVTVLVEAAGHSTLTEGFQQRALISFVFDELAKTFERSE